MLIQIVKKNGERNGAKEAGCYKIILNPQTGAPEVHFLGDCLHRRRREVRFGPIPPAAVAGKQRARRE